MQALRDRKSDRSLSEKKLSIQVISDLLWASFGINRPDSGMRTAPSAVNWQEIDIYAAMSNGRFLYNAAGNRLDPVLKEDIRPLTAKQDFAGHAPLVLIFVADFSRMEGASDRDRQFYSAADTGFISQNVYLFCASEGLSTVVVGYLDRDALSKAMKLGPEQRIILTQPVGYPAGGGR
jgi:nitroreductase